MFLLAPGIEPLINNKLINGFPVSPPLDGSDSRIPIARSENDLFQLMWFHS